MKAKIFYLNQQQNLFGEIARLLKQYVYADIDVLPQNINDMYPDILMNDQELFITQSYANLLMASMVKVDDFKVYVEDRYGHWWYMGHLGGYVGYEDHVLRIARDSIASLFPAVALMDRMVLLPQGIYEAFDKSRRFSYFPKPLDLQGVLLVDFRDHRAIEEAVRQVGAHLKIEIAKLCRRYMAVNRILQPDFDDLTKILRIDKRFFEQYQSEIYTPPVKLIPKVVSDPVQLAKRSQVVLEIQNESEVAVGRVRVQVRAPSGTLTAPVAEYLDFSAGNKQIQTIRFEVIPSMTPYCPLEVLFVPDELGQMYTTFPIPVVLEVV
jgi:hypothetical protein